MEHGGHVCLLPPSPPPGDHIEISDPEGSFSGSRLHSTCNVLLIAAGTGGHWSYHYVISSYYGIII